MKISNLATPQKAVLIAIVGTISFLALGDLSKTSLDYYVSAAVFNAVFRLVLMISLNSPLLFLFRFRNGMEKSSPKFLEVDAGRIAELLLWVVAIVLSMLSLFLVFNYSGSINLWQ